MFLFHTIQAQDAKPMSAEEAAFRISLCGHHDTLASKAMLLDCDKVQVGEGTDPSISVAGFTFYYVPKVGNPYIEISRDSKLSQGMVKVISESKPGDIIVLTEVECTIPRGKKIVNGPAYTIQ